MRYLALVLLSAGWALCGAAVEAARPRPVHDDPAFRELAAQNRELRLQLDQLRREAMRAPVERPGVVPAGGADLIPQQKLPTQPKE